MGLARGLQPHPRAIIFDLDRSLIDSRNAWRYCIEESLASATGRRFIASELVDEYHTRPWRDALRILAPLPEDADRCEGLCQTMFERSAMKRLLVHEGIGMALDALRGEAIELGAISRLPHPVAVKQIQSTGLDRFLAVVAPTPAGEAWNVAARIQQCLTFLEAEPVRSAYAGADPYDLKTAKASGLRAYCTLWVPAARGNPGDVSFDLPGSMQSIVLRDWPAAGRT